MAVFPMFQCYHNPQFEPNAFCDSVFGNRLNTYGSDQTSQCYHPKPLENFANTNHTLKRKTLSLAFKKIKLCTILLAFFRKKWGSYLAKNDFWRKVFRGTAKGPRPTLHSFCKAEIRNLKKKIKVNNFFCYYKKQV